MKTGISIMSSWWSLCTPCQNQRSKEMYRQGVQRASFDAYDRDVRVLTQPRGDDEAGDTATNDDVVIRVCSGVRRNVIATSMRETGDQSGEQDGKNKGGFHRGRRLCHGCKLWVGG